MVCPTSWTNCESSANWNIGINITSLILCFLQIDISTFLLIMHKKKIRNAQAHNKHYKILGAQISLALVRLVWWVLNLYVYKDNTAAAIVTQVFNRLGFLALFLMQSFNIQSWFLLIFIKYTRMKLKIVNIVFLTINIAVSLFILVEIIIRCSDKVEISETLTKFYKLETLYWVGNYVMSVIMLITSITYLVLGIMLVKRYHRLFGICDKQMVQFWMLSTAFTGSSLLRFICYIYASVAGSEMNPNAFQILCYFIPDFVPLICSTYTEINLYIVNMKYTKNEPYGEELYIQN